MLTELRGEIEGRQRRVYVGARRVGGDRELSTRKLDKRGNGKFGQKGGRKDERGVEGTVYKLASQFKNTP